MFNPPEGGRPSASRRCRSRRLAPVIDAAKVGKIAGVSPASAYKLIADLERLGILKEITGGQRGRTYMFADYVKLFR